MRSLWRRSESENCVRINDDVTKCKFLLMSELPLLNASKKIRDSPGMCFGKNRVEEYDSTRIQLCDIRSRASCFCFLLARRES
jgi:hypothetical protein